MGASGKFRELLGAYFVHWHDRRVEANIKLKILYEESVRKEHREETLKKAQIRYSPNSSLTPSTTYIYGDKVAIIHWSDVPMAFLIRSANVAESHRHFLTSSGTTRNLDCDVHLVRAAYSLT
jgi:hypothetical protein